MEVPNHEGSVRRGFPGWRWRLVAILGIGVAALVIVFSIHPFLSVNQPRAAKVLVVEGWLPDYAMEAAVAEFRRGSYTRLFTTGGPHPRGSFLSEYGSYAESAAATVLKLGLSTNEVVAVPSQVRYRNRTYGAAVALREYCERRGVELRSINLVSLGAHSRRSWLCFRRALEGRAEVGILAIENREYDPARWWAFSEGAKTTFGEAIGLVYAWVARDTGG